MNAQTVNMHDSHNHEIDRRGVRRDAQFGC